MQQGDIWKGDLTLAKLLPCFHFLVQQIVVCINLFIFVYIVIRWEWVIFGFSATDIEGSIDN